MTHRMITSKQDLFDIKTQYENDMRQYDRFVYVCGGAGCVSSHCEEVRSALVSSLETYGLEKKVKVIVTGCIGMCAMGPVILVAPDGVFYTEMTPAKTANVVKRHLLGNEIVEDYTYYDASLGRYVPKIQDITFFKEQVRIVLRNCGEMDYSAIDAYISRDGYAAAAKVFETMKPEDVVSEMIASGLRGRGGAGFPIGIKWQAGLKAVSKQKYIVCNADEGDPGAFMDRSVLEGDPHSIIEGLMIGGYAIGASMGYIYVRAEYPLAVERMEVAILQARESGLLGKNILGSGFDFDVDIRIGAGAFVCGEETALLASIEGERGEPRQKPPFPFEKGLFNYPTIINNVETLANVPPIILKGAGWYASYGVGKSKGTKVFALAGDIANTGIVEVPMGTKLKDIIFKIGGGIKDGKTFKAVQIGGPSGGCLTKDHLDVSVDYESLAAVGAIVGSGGLIVMDENTCLVDTARYFMDFVQDESCGQCLPCRNGTKRMLETLIKIVNGNGEPKDIDNLQHMAETIKDTAMCGLGQTAPNPVLTTLKYFRDEYEAHVIEKRCPAHICRNLLRYEITPGECRGCTLCAKNCPVHAITGAVKEPHVINADMCIKCGACMVNCRFGAISVK